MMDLTGLIVTEQTENYTQSVKELQEKSYQDWLEMSIK